MRILAIGAHADDVELGCGGSLAKWAREGHALTIHVATDSAYAAPYGRVIRGADEAREEARRAAARLGATLDIGPYPVFGLAAAADLGDTLVSLFERVRPDLCLVHWHGDTHLDHAALARATLHASRRCPRLLGYASNWYPGFEPFPATYYVDTSDTLEEKLALIAEYESECGRTGGAWTDHARSAAALHGRVVGTAAAEAFVTYRWLA